MYQQLTATSIMSTNTLDSNTTRNKEKKKRNPNANNCSLIGIHGVRLKRFEQVVAKLLLSVEPYYVRLPPPIPSTSRSTSVDNNNGNNNDNNNDIIDDDYPFSGLPRSARVVGNHPNLKRAHRKEGQLKSMIACILRLIPPSTSRPIDSCYFRLGCNDDRTTTNRVNEKKSTGTTPTTIVDFGGGSGHLGIPLALLLRNCRIVVVDLNQRSIDLLHEKAATVIKEIESEIDPNGQKIYADLVTFSSHQMISFENNRYNNNPSIRCCGGSSDDGDNDNGGGGGRILDNLFTFHGPVQDFVEPFDIAIALHLCGEATDVCLRKAIDAQAAAIVVAPCCVGKLSSKAFNPDVYHATGHNHATVTYPQSDVFCRLISSTSTTTSTDNNDKQQDDWNVLAKAADYSNEDEFGTSRNASRRTAKALLETDRRLYLEDNMYMTALMKMQPLEVSPKNDILVAWKPKVYDGRKTCDTNVVNLEELFSTPDVESKADIEVCKSHLLLPINNDSTATATTTNSISQQVVDHNDWTIDEEEEIKRTIFDFLNSDDSMNQVMVFPTRMGGRKRKLIHFVADKLNVAHWSKGKKVSEKTVVIARRRQQK